MKDFLFKGKDRTDIMALALCLAAFSFFSIVLSYKFFHFGYYDWDLAFFAQGMWGLCHGAGYVSLFDTNFFSNHANLIAVLIVPIYKLFPHPLTLVLLKVLSFVTAAYVLYVFAKEKLGPPTAFLFLCLYLFYIPNLFGIFYEFDFESLAPPFLMLIFYFYEKERWLGFLVCAGILILIKENLSLIVLAFSIHALFIKKDKIRWAVIPGALALVSFYLLVCVFIPYMSGRPIGEGHPYYIGENYKDLGGSIQGILFSFIFHPIRVWHYILTPENTRFLFILFNPFMYLPLASPGVLFLISPIIVQHLLSSSMTEHSILFAYVLTMSPVLFLATISTLEYIHKNLRPAYPFVLMVLSFLSLLYFFMLFTEHHKRFILNAFPNQTQQILHDQWELVRLVPPDASVLASFSFLAPLSQRKDLYAFYKIYDPKFQSDQWSYKLPPDVQYALIDSRDPWLLKESDYKSAKERARKFLASGDWIVLKKYGRFTLYKRKAV